MENGLQGNKEEDRENTGACYKSQGQKWSEVDVPGYLNHTSKIELSVGRVWGCSLVVKGRMM